MTRLTTAWVSGTAVAIAWMLATSCSVSSALAADEASLPAGARAVWDLDKAFRNLTPTRERISINGLWRWQPAETKTDHVPVGRWGYFKVPGCWPGITDYMQQDCQTVYAHPKWQQVKLGEVTAAWYQREISIPQQWAGRRITVSAETLNSHAVVHVDGRIAGEMRFPAGEVDLTSVCRPGAKHVLSMYVAAMPLKAVMMSFSDTASSKQARGAVQRRGLCGDVYLASSPAGPAIEDVRVRTSVRKAEITFSLGLRDLDPSARYALRAEVRDPGGKIATIPSQPFQAAAIRDGRIEFSGKWKPERLWDLHTPDNQCQVTVSLFSAAGNVVDISHPTSFGFREFWIDGRDFYLNGTRIFLSALPLDNAQVGAVWASYDGAKESLLRLKSIGINFVYTHNYGCEPGTHLSFSEVLKAADDVGMLVALSQPHFGQYDWQAPGADEKNGYANHAAFYVGVAGSHPSVVMYSMSHNATGYAEDMNPDMIDGLPDSGARDSWALNNVKRAGRAEAIVGRMDPGRIVYHHSSGNLGSMHTVNFYTNMAPLQELDDWFEHWATKGVKPFFTCEYMVPCTWDWTMYRGWYKGSREFGSAVVPWEFCVAEWSAQFLGDRAYRISEEEKKNLRWEAEQFRAGRLWHRWDYPYQVGSRVFENQHEIIGKYLASNWRAFRTWGVSAVSPWEHDFFWSLRPGVDKGRQQLKVDWENLQRPGFSPDYLDRRYERMDLAYQRSDWVPTADGQAILRHNMPLLAYLGGKPAAFTSKDHNFTPGETLEKQFIVINNSRQRVACDCRWSLGLPEAVSGAKRITVATGEQERIPLQLKLPHSLAPGRYVLRASAKLSTGETQEDSFTVHVLPRSEPARSAARIALWDPKGETARLLADMGVRCQTVDAKADLSGFEVLIVGKGALTVDGPGPDLGRVRDGLVALVFEQTSEALEQRLGFRVAEYGLRQVFPRVPDHPLLAGLGAEHLQDWRGAATLLPPRLTYELSPRYSYTPTVKWCGLEVPRVWRCGNRGNVASVLIEKPARGDFLPTLDGGYALQYSPLMEYREGKGRVLFCQLDLTGRTEDDPAARQLVRNILSWVISKPDRQPAPSRRALYVGDPAGRRHLASSGITAGSYDGGNISAEQVLIVGTGAGKRLAENSRAIADFLKAGGRLLLLGLDEQETNAFLPMKVSMKKAEHIACCFDPPPADSPFAGISPADVHNRDPRAIPLVSSAAEILGDGVLARGLSQVPALRRGATANADGTVSFPNVVFCQFPPYTLTSAQGIVPSLVVDARDAAVGEHSALVTLGTTAGAQFGQKVELKPQVGKSYTFAVLANPSFETGQKPWFFTFHEKQNLRRTFRRSSFALTRLTANLGVRGDTPLLSRFSMPAGGGQGEPRPSVVRNGDFTRAAARDGMPDQWQFSSDSPQATCTRESAGADGKPALRLTLGDRGAKGQPSVMLAQHDVPVKEGQWYRITLRAKVEGTDGKAVGLTIQNTQNWTALIDYLSFTPRKDWRTFTFLVQSNGTADSKTRFQIWHGNVGTLWLADVAMTPVAPPSAEGRWSQGLYLDQPEAWDDPYRFFRW